MNTDLLEWDEDQTVDSEEEYQALLNGLKRSQGFGLYFVQCSPFSSGKLIERVQADLTDKTIKVLKFEQPIADGNVFKRVNAFLQEHPSDVLFIQGLENSLAAAEETKKRLGWSSEKIEKLNWREVPLVLNNLNQQRERFRDSFPNTCLVFLLPQYAINYLAHRSPDFFDWRSGVSKFIDDAETVFQESFRIFLQKKTVEQYRSWAPEQRSRRILEIQSLLEGQLLDQAQKWTLYLEQAGLFAISKEWEAALSALNQVTEIVSDDFESLRNKGLLLTILGRYGEAVSSYENALAVKPDDYETLCNKGIALWKSGNYEQAISAYDDALTIKPNLYEALCNKGLALSSVGRYKEAILAYDGALKIKPNEYEAWGSRGIALAKIEHFEEALNSYDQVLAIKPDLDYAFYEKACCYGLQGQVEPALENLERAIQLSPDEYREMAKTDSDFDAIREDPRFRVLVEGNEG